MNQANTAPAENDRFFDDLFAALPALAPHHMRTSAAYRLLAGAARHHVAATFSGTDDTAHPFGPFGPLRFPYHSMGNVDSLDLFGLDELIILAFYWQNRGRYRRVADLGANIGLHSIALHRCGFETTCFEPDPDTHSLLAANLARNDAAVTANQAAVSVEAGQCEFVRVNGNRTGSHLAGAKNKPYGDLERFPVTLSAFGPIAEWADLMKIDVEGHEAVLIESTDRDLWSGVDAMIEVGTPENAQKVFRHLTAIGVNMFSQKAGWGPVATVEDVPVGHQEGSLFITTKTAMPWAGSSTDHDRPANREEKA